jgi:hypothetical protein
MAHPRRYGSSGSVHFTSPQIPRRLTVDCPRCKALPGSRCFRRNSWVLDDTREGGGFYTALAKVPCPERKVPTVTTPAPETPIRTRINAVIMRKLTGNDRMETRYWAASTRRTVGELEAKLAELEALPDLAW